MLDILLFDISIGLWEKTYLRYLFSSVENTVTTVSLQESRRHLTIDSYYHNMKHTNHDRCLIFSTHPNPKHTINTQMIVMLLNFFEPKIVVHLSDEKGKYPNLFGVVDKVQLYLHQYNFEHYPKHNSLCTLPLGFNNSICSVPPTIVKPMWDRKFVWSFIGNCKRESRVRAIDAFKEHFKENIYPHYVGSGIAQHKMGEYLSETVFCLSPKGASNIACFRTTEAICFGAIPVIACPTTVFDIGYCFDKVNDIVTPPVIHAPTWEDACAICMDLMNRPDDLQRISDECRAWFFHYNSYVQKRIAHSIQSS